MIQIQVTQYFSFSHLISPQQDNYITLHGGRAFKPDTYSTLPQQLTVSRVNYLISVKKVGQKVKKSNFG